MNTLFNPINTPHVRNLFSLHWLRSQTDIYCCFLSRISRHFFELMLLFFVVFFIRPTANTSHVVHELTFGPRLPPRMLRKIPAHVKHNIDPLAGRSFINRDPHMSHEHYIKIVSTMYEVGTLIGHDEILGYQVSHQLRL